MGRFPIIIDPEAPADTTAQVLSSTVLFPILTFDTVLTNPIKIKGSSTKKWVIVITGRRLLA